MPQPTPLANALSQYAPPQQTPSTPLANALMEYAKRVQGDFAHNLDESAQGFGEMVNGQLATGIPRTFLGGLGWMGSPVSGAVSPLLNPVLQPVAQGVHDYVGKPVENATGYPADLTTELALALPKALHGAGKAVNSAVPYLASLGDAVGSKIGAPADAYLSGAVPKAAEDGIIAYHGSPHTFDKFSMDKIGTGEGNQVYLRGLYFAGNEDVSNVYRDNLSSKVIDSYGAQKAADIAKEWADTHGGDKAAAAAELQARMDQRFGGKVPRMGEPGFETHKKYFEAIDLLNGKRPGATYQVRLNVTHNELIDWDKPMSEQPKPLQQSLKRAGVPDWVLNDSTNAGIWLKRAERNRHHASDFFEGNGGELILTPKELVDRLHNAGVKGVKYKDAGSRDGVAGGSYNYVIFDDKLVDILKRYGIPMTAGAAGAMIVSGENMPPEIADQLGTQG